MFENIREDVRYKARDFYGSDSFRHCLKALFEEGTLPTIIFRTANFLYKYRLTLLAWVFKQINHVFFGILIGPNADIGPGFLIAHSDGVVINCHARIGSHLVVQHQVTIGQRNNQMPTVGNYVMCGCGSKILGACTVGDNVKIGANAVVVHDVPSNCTVVGIPARVVKQRQAQEQPAQ
ncbi:MAG: serine acetyltransferase [Candidatus Glassbacteria bacterium]|nr:serine acetyltransferase [Candidatus Glassbacteria bacterium]